ncbi:MAG TPA: sulfotransferase [Actinomycetota bacterium]
MSTLAPRTKVGRLPTFLIVGGMKCGTTALYRYLQAHPDVYMPAVKAPEFFVEEANWGRGVDWYRRMFAGAPPDAVAIGEASNAYTKYPTFRGVPERIAAHLPDVRMIYAVRDPIDRIRSHYQTRVWQGDERAPIETAVFDDPRYVAYSRYGMQLERYLACFPRERILVITSEALRNDRVATLRRVLSFVGADAEVVPDNADREFYRSGDHARSSLVPLRVRKALKRHLPAAKRGKELENRLFRALDVVRGRPAAPPRAPVTMPDDVRARLASLLDDDVRRLRELVGPAVDAWGLGDSRGGSRGDTPDAR